MQLTIKIQSISDIITNSSSELFSIRTDLSKKELQSLLEKIHNQYNYTGTWEEWYELSNSEKEKFDYSSGMGGILKVETFDDKYQEQLQYIPSNKKHLFTKEIFSLFYEKSLEELEKELTVDIDEKFTCTINWIINNLYVVDSNCHPSVKNKEGRVVKLLSWDEEDYILDNKIEK